MIECVVHCKRLMEDMIISFWCKSHIVLWSLVDFATLCPPTITIVWGNFHQEEVNMHVIKELIVKTFIKFQLSWMCLIAWSTLRYLKINDSRRWMTHLYLIWFSINIYPIHKIYFKTWAHFPKDNMKHTLIIWCKMISKSTLRP